MDNIKQFIQKIEILKSKKDFDDAIIGIQEMLVTNEDYRLYEELADIYLYMGKLEKALKAVSYSLSINEDSATGNYLKGFILLSKNKIKESIDFLEKSNNLIPNNAEVLRNLGWAYSMVDEKDKGIMILKRALNLSPSDELIIEDLAMALIGVGEVKEGNTLLEKIGRKELISK